MNPNSTNVRSLPFALRLARTTLRAAAAVSPPAAARVAERLFLSPPRHAAPRREREALARAERFEVRDGRTRLSAFRFGEGPAVLAVHGWGGRAGQMAPIALALAEAGCAAVAFDGPGHGGSSGRTASVIQFGDAVAAVAERLGARAAVGHSAGAAGVAYALLRHRVPLDAAVLVGPPHTPESFVSDFSAALGLGARVEALVRERLARRFGVRVEELDLLAHPGTARATTPLLVVHDRGDAEVPFEHGAAIARAWPGARLLATEGLGHRRVLRDRAVAAEIAAFVAGRLRRCGCGRLAGYGVDRDRCAACALERGLLTKRWAA
jgi:pimeloyl-ACP methyl ester carboxylesterase